MQNVITTISSAGLAIFLLPRDQEFISQMHNGAQG
jgi:hypothetical protein